MALAWILRLPASTSATDRRRQRPQVEGEHVRVARHKPGVCPDERQRIDGLTLEVQLAAASHVSGKA
jgi:hypothetical protein